MKKESVDEMPDDNEAENVPDDNQNESPQYVDEHDTEDDEVKPTTDAERDPEEYDGDTRRSRKKRRSSTSSRSRPTSTLGRALEIVPPDGHLTLSLMTATSFLEPKNRWSQFCSASPILEEFLKVVDLDSALRV